MKECPVKPLLDQSLASARDLNHSLRQMRIAMKACPACPLRDSCPIMLEFYQSLDIALKEIFEEWGLT